MMTSAPVTFRSRLWRWTKRLTLFATMSIVAAGAAGYFGLPVLARQSWARHKTEKAVSRAMGAPIQIGDMTFSWKNGLTLLDVSSPENPAASFRAAVIRIQPRYARLLGGKLRATALVKSPVITLDESAAAAAPLKFPRFSKHGFKLEKVEILDGTYVVTSAATSRSVRVEHLSTQGTGRLEKRTFRLDLASITGTINGAAVEGKGVLRVTPDGLGGEFDVNEPAGLRDALRAAHVTIKKAPVLSEPF